MYVVAWLGIRKVHRAHVNEGAFKSRELVCQSLLVSRASVHELPLAAYTKVPRDEGFGETHRCNQPTRFSRACGAAPTKPAPLPLDQISSGETLVPSRLRLAIRPPFVIT